ncbi:MAG: P-II family nitrogen regulator [Nitrospirae bacterium]|nr:MAG: P-II family nitrogen regulator [Nitrospirota bacterium]
MKEIIAYIKPHKLSDVTLALQKVEGLRGISVSEVKGFGRREGQEHACKIDSLLDFAPYARIEIFCNDDLADKLISIVNEVAYTGIRGDGKIYVLNVQQAIKIGKGAINA